MAVKVASSSSSGVRSPRRKASTSEQASPCHGVSPMPATLPGRQGGEQAVPVLHAPRDLVELQREAERPAALTGLEVQPDDALRGAVDEPPVAPAVRPPRHDTAVVGLG